MEREWLPSASAHWQAHRHLSFRLDGNHPPGASHHQKVVVIDNKLAFVGGLDLTLRRWDDSRHAPGAPLRMAEGKPELQPGNTDEDGNPGDRPRHRKFTQLSAPRISQNASN
ncbi:hypothetical protein AU476_03945 [Cupriavidus sp. UYMSc13B]|nr:hypothetical protein AU476_03945 [Cupriavidus sp. UYMSc13B]